MEVCLSAGCEKTVHRNWDLQVNAIFPHLRSVSYEII